MKLRNMYIWRNRNFTALFRNDDTVNIFQYLYIISDLRYFFNSKYDTSRQSSVHHYTLVYKIIYIFTLSSDFRLTG